jgi:hypothetical protein
MIMGDSDFTWLASVVAIAVVVVALIAFVIAWRVRKRAVRVVIGILLLAAAALCGILSLWATLVVNALGVAALGLAFAKPRNAPSEAQNDTEP